MIIDCHGHVSAPAALWAYKSLILSHRGSHGRGAGLSDKDRQAIFSENAKRVFNLKL